MASHLIKVAPDRDSYVIWSVTDAGPEWIGTRAETEIELKERGDYSEDRFARANETGSSARRMQGSEVVPYGWDDAFITVGEGLPSGTGLRRLPREALEEYALAAVEGREDDMLAMTLPYE
ncbi:hypothetical protein AB0F88_17035 [Streptosporangium sp. NPDC023963]|uniref:hypothetical protein n=1 Tax=Streptosporangium sp. NPDC023963 TaxID=3155608 RepID=UPI0034295A77